MSEARELARLSLNDDPERGHVSLLYAGGPTPVAMRIVCMDGTSASVEMSGQEASLLASMLRECVTKAEEIAETEGWR